MKCGLVANQLKIPHPHFFPSAFSRVDDHCLQRRKHRACLTLGGTGLCCPSLNPPPGVVLLFSLYRCPPKSSTRCHLNFTSFTFSPSPPLSLPLARLTCPIKTYRGGIFRDGRLLGGYENLFYYKIIFTRYQCIPRAPFLGGWGGLFLGKGDCEDRDRRAELLLLITLTLLS